ncbi:diguanylate cyclase [Conexibacter stalactiti]|uniref:Diguanylate cyclase n=1 Tax=Conexibacter stalactiti TaxID=1940611 RepID=A0ABU4HP70_9ACTN|nr:diguanylate cyclase [Conexibacter stalactiti]MDW5595096.1 diguanylate cyclase [Conexibacter stalactiti]MEC5035738.1 diguanylate cyclase [Conexibacter stalactiti]
MSFRTRLTLFFMLIVVVPMVALGVAVSRLVTDSEEGKANARAGAHVTSAMRIFERSAERAALSARALGGDRALTAAIRDGDRAAATRRARALAAQKGLERVVITTPGRATPFVDVGDPDALAAGSARVRGNGSNDQLATVQASTLGAEAFVQLVASPDVEVIVRRGDRILASSLPPAGRAGATGTARATGTAGATTGATPLPERGTTTIGDVDYVVAGFRADDFDGAQDAISVLTDSSSTATAVARNRRLALGLLGAFLVLAFVGAILVSRQLQGQIGRFLSAAKRIGGGDFSTAVPTEGRDEFAQLGDEFNKMSHELERRIGELDRERGRLRASIQRVGETFASNLDRRALLEIGTETIAEAVEATAGRAGAGTDEVRVGEIEPFGAVLDAAERRARATNAPAEHSDGDLHALASPIPRAREDAGPLGYVVVARAGRPFGDEEHALLGSLAAQTGISLENVDLHDQVARQAVTDELTGLFNHRRFQEVMTAEVLTAQRFGQPVGLLLLDIDNFKRVNDTYGHQQGDVVLREVARVLRESSREIDEPARYGGEEMAVALPQTDLEGAFTIAERVRTAVEALAVARLDGEGLLQVTVSIGVAASATAEKDELVAAADAALYTAKRSGKNRTVRAPAATVASVEAE